MLRFLANTRPFFRICKAVCIFSYLPVSCFSLGCCRAVCFPALVKILAYNIWGCFLVVIYYCWCVKIVVVDF